MTADLRPCCQQAVLDGVRPEDHFPDCDGRDEDPPQDALFRIVPERPGTIRNTPRTETPDA